MGASMAEADLPEAREVAHMLARFACNNHTITEEGGDPIGVPRHCSPKIKQSRST